MNSCKKSFTEGLSGFLRFAANSAGAYIQNRSNMSASDIQDFAVGSNFYILYLADAIDTWKV
jgi:hypothetical protein